MTPDVFNLNYLSFYLAKCQKQGQFWNPQKKQISKLTLLFEFSENLMEILSKNKSRNSVLHPLCVKVILMAKIGPSF